jgi:hypothetical protein
MYIGEEEASIYMDVEEDSIYICIYIYIPSRRTICYMHVCSIENTFYVLHRDHILCVT